MGACFGHFALVKIPLTILGKLENKSRNYWAQVECGRGLAVVSSSRSYFLGCQPGIKPTGDACIILYLKMLTCEVTSRAEEICFMRLEISKIFFSFFRRRCTAHMGNLSSFLKYSSRTIRSQILQNRFFAKKNCLKIQKTANKIQKKQTKLANQFLNLVLVLMNTVKTKPLFRGMLYPFWVWNQNGGVTYFGYFSR